MKAVATFHEVKFSSLLSPLNWTINEGEFAWLTIPHPADHSAAIDTIFYRKPPRHGHITLWPSVTHKHCTRLVSLRAPALHKRSLLYNIRFPHSLNHKHLNAPLDDSVADLLSLFELDNLAQRPFEEVEPSAQIKTLIARSLLFSPRLIILDNILPTIESEVACRLFTILHALTRHGLCVLNLSPITPNCSQQSLVGINATVLVEETQHEQ
ncbi:MAG: hypothetical protein VXW87_01800 [Pseudomonadota bacterium]|nr:hypothetical protein [Pseudomonadota bacterium]